MSYFDGTVFASDVNGVYRWTGSRWEQSSSQRAVVSLDPSSDGRLYASSMGQGVEVFTSTKLFNAKKEGDLKTVVFDCHGKMTSVSAEEILFALGRVPNTTGMVLGTASTPADMRVVRKVGTARAAGPLPTWSSVIL